MFTLKLVDNVTYNYVYFKASRQRHVYLCLL